MSDETDTTGEVARVLGEPIAAAIQLDLLPVGSVIVDPIDEAGDAPVVACKNSNRLWQAMGDTEAGPLFTSAQVMSAASERLVCVYRPQVANCGSCAACDPGLIIDGRPTGFSSRMSVCPDCGNKRCPKAANHAKWQCSGSNAVGQEGVAVPAGQPSAGSAGRGGSGGSCARCGAGITLPAGDPENREMAVCMPCELAVFKEGWKEARAQVEAIRGQIAYEARHGDAITRCNLVAERFRTVLNSVTKPEMNENEEA